MSVMPKVDCLTRTVPSTDIWQFRWIAITNQANSQRRTDEPKKKSSRFDVGDQSYNAIHNPSTSIAKSQVAGVASRNMRVDG
jgi:hypothetical protein